jgi:hypothetical protein
MKRPEPEPGMILELPYVDLTNTITPPERLGHIVLVLSLLSSGVVVCGVSIPPTRVNQELIDTGHR